MAGSEAAFWVACCREGFCGVVQHAPPDQPQPAERLQRVRRGLRGHRAHHLPAHAQPEELPCADGCQPGRAHAPGQALPPEAAGTKCYVNRLHRSWCGLAELISECLAAQLRLLHTSASLHASHSSGLSRTSADAGLACQSCLSCPHATSGSPFVPKLLAGLLLPSILLVNWHGRWVDSLSVKASPPPADL